MQRPLKLLSWATLGLFAFVSTNALRAQTFAPVPAISFTKVFAGADPLPQTLTINSVGAAFNFRVTSTTSTGGNWLTVTTGAGCGLCPTPHSVFVAVNPMVTLAAGTYSGQIVLTSQTGSVSLTIPVALIIAAAGGTYFDNTPGQMSFALDTGGRTPPPESIQVRNAGSGTLNFTLSSSTSDGGGWLSLSAASGAAPATVSVTLSPQKLPGGGLTAGTFIGQLLFQAAASSVTVPVSVVVGPNVFSQVNAISFTKPFSGADPLPQTLTITSPGDGPNFRFVSDTARGGDWLAVSAGAGCALCGLPHTITATIKTVATLAVGTYSGQIVVTSQTGDMSITVPVTLTVAPVGGTYLDNFPGQMSFVVKTAGTTSTSQSIEIRNSGTGTLSWTGSGSTSDGGNWLTVSTTSGTAPSVITIGVSVPNLPNGGLIAGTFIGQVLFQSSTGSVTVPVSVVVGNNILSQVNAINFTKAFGGANPLPQTITITSPGEGPNFRFEASTATGGDWLTITSGAGCALCATPHSIMAAITASPTLAVGTYTGQILVVSQTGNMSITVPVTLTVADGGNPYFDNLPGQMSFSFVTAGAAPPSQSLQIRSAGSGTLDWTLSLTTSDGGAWLSATAMSGTAPSTFSITVLKQNLPNQGLIGGTFIGEAVFRSSTGSSASVPISVVVADNVYGQVNAISFTKPFGGANPLSQTLTIASTGSSVNFRFESSTARGGDWLTVTAGAGCALCGSPHTLTAAITAPPTLAVGTYTGQIVITTQTGDASMTVPVTLTVATGGAFFDNVPGQVSFSLVTNGGNPPSQTVEIRNAAGGSLNWTVTASTSDSGNWLSVSAGTGTATSTVTVGVTVSALPNMGLIAGTFTGQLLFQSAGSSVTVPVSVVVGPTVFVQLPLVMFTKPFGGSNPLPQTLSVAGTGAGFNFTLASSTGNGGNWLSVATGSNCALCATPRSLTISVNPSATLAGGSYTGQIVMTSQTGSMAMTVPVILTIASTTTSPVIRTTDPVVPSFLGKSDFGSNMYVEIYGSNLATTTRTWAGADFSGSNAPTSLDQVSVSVNGKPAFVYFISPGQININTPEDTATGPVQVQVRNASGPSNAVTVNRARVSPTLQSIPQFSIGGKQYVVAQTPDFKSFIGAPGMLAGLSFVSAKPGDTVIIFALGCGPTNPASQAGVVASQNAPLALPFQVRIGGVAAQVPFGGISGGTIGLYQFNVVVPNVAAGDQTIELILDGVPNAQNLTIVIG